MVQIILKAKHFYFIAYHLKNGTISQYFSLISRIKSALVNNTDLELNFAVDVNYEDVIMIYRILTLLPEGQSNSINTEMASLLEQQIGAGYIYETASGLVEDADGNLPDNAYWHKIAKEITYTRNNNILAKNNAIAEGQNIINTI